MEIDGLRGGGRSTIRLKLIKGLCISQPTLLLSFIRWPLITWEASSEDNDKDQVEQAINSPGLYIMITQIPQWNKSFQRFDVIWENGLHNQNVECVRIDFNYQMPWDSKSYLKNLSYPKELEWTFRQQMFIIVYNFKYLNKTLCENQKCIIISGKLHITM